MPNNNEQKGFIVYGDTKAVVDELTDSQAGQLFRGMLEYFVDGSEPDFADMLKIAFIPIKQQMDRDSDKYAKRCDRNRENANKRWGNKTDANYANGCDRIRTDANYANTDTNTDTDSDISTGVDVDTKSPESDIDNLPLSLISYLNQKTGSNYKADGKVTSQIIGLLGQGYSEADIKTVIDRKCMEWSCDGKMRSYLRPSTLFGEKFAEYLNAPEPIEVEEEQAKKKNIEQLREELSDKQDELITVNSQIQEIRNDGDPPERIDELNDLKLRAAILEDQIDSLRIRTRTVAT